MALVMIVDDEAGIREVIRRWVSGAGHETCDAGDAEQALNIADARRPAVVFCDIQMPGHDGIWLTKQIRRRFADMAVVLATTVTTVPPSVSMQGGVLSYLIKPLNQKPLLEALDTALSWHRDAVAAGAPAEDMDRLEHWLAELVD